MSVFNSKAENSTDLYGTPESATDLILPHLSKRLRIWEPCRGFGAISSYLERLGYDVVATDIRDGQDALHWEPEAWDVAVTNPPWSLKTEFLERFYQRGKPFAFLLPADLVNGRRTSLFGQYGLQLVVPSWRVKYLRFDGEQIAEAGAPNTGSAWFCSGMNLPKDLNFVVR